MSTSPCRRDGALPPTAISWSASPPTPRASVPG
jgi:hypothetical protein